MEWYLSTLYGYTREWLVAFAADWHFDSKLVKEKISLCGYILQTYLPIETDECQRQIKGGYW